MSSEPEVLNWKYSSFFKNENSNFSKSNILNLEKLINSELYDFG